MIEKLVLFPYYFVRHNSHLISGTIRFAKKYNIPLEISFAKGNLADIQSRYGIAFLRMTSTCGKDSLICFDMSDWPDIACFEALDVSDIYVKRSYSEQHINLLPDVYRKKIQPYGLYFACSQEDLGLELLVSFNALVNSFKNGVGKGVTETVAISKWLIRVAIKKKPAFLPLEKLESITGGENKIFYHTRIWNPKFHQTHSSKTVEQLNDFRMQMVKVLKREFGQKFIGGVLDSEYARMKCPSLITTHGADTNSYLKHLRQCKIVITETGLHGSIGSRLGEYFAASRCVLSEPLIYKIPQEPVDLKDWCTYQSETACLNHCDNLLTSGKKVDEIIQNAKEYYQRFTSPQETIGCILKSTVAYT